MKTYELIAQLLKLSVEEVQEIFARADLSGRPFLRLEAQVVFRDRLLKGGPLRPVESVKYSTRDDQLSVSLGV